MLLYAKKFEDEGGIVYSCDMLRFKLQFKEDLIEEVVNRFGNYDRLDVTIYPLCTAPFKFRHLLKIDYNLSSATLGIGFNGADRFSMFDGFYEVNPNKCIKIEKCMQDIQYIFSCCWSVDLVRWDLAVDIPTRRSLVRLIKDQRTYSIVRNSVENFTEYLGQMDKVGRVKVYNKTIESNLLDDVTRVEVTLPDIYNKVEFDKLFPVVMIQGYQSSIPFNDLTLNDTDKVLVELLRNCDNPDYYLKRLGRKKRDKLSEYVYSDCEKLHFNLPFIFALYNYYKQLLLF